MGYPGLHAPRAPPMARPGGLGVVGAYAPPVIGARSAGRAVRCRTLNRGVNPKVPSGCANVKTLSACSARTGMLGCSAYGAGRDPLDGSSGGHPAATAAPDTLCCRLPAATADTATLLRLGENKANRRSELVAPPGSGCRGLLVDHREVLACAGAGFRYPRHDGRGRRVRGAPGGAACATRPQALHRPPPLPRPHHRDDPSPRITSATHASASIEPGLAPDH